MKIITEELAERGIVLQPGTEAVVKRVIHATADFDYAENLVFLNNPVTSAIRSLTEDHVPLITDTNMALSGLSRKALSQLDCRADCYMADPEVAAAARADATTRAAAAMRKAARDDAGAVLAGGNAPTALFTIADLMETGLRPALIVAVPVGFVNVVEAKEKIIGICTRTGTPAIVARGRKGGSTVATAICNALLYSATDMLDPSRRGWN